MTRPEPADAAFELFRDRVDAYCADQISDPDFAALAAELLASEPARRYFVAYLQLHAELGFASRADRAASLALDRVQAAVAVAVNPAFASLAESLADRSGAARRGRIRARSRLRWVALGGLVASVALVGVGLAVIPRGGWVRLALTPSSPPEATAPAGNVAWLVNAQDCRWADPGETPGRDMTVGKFLRLESGLAEVEFDRGARVIMQGPATLELLSGNMARLLRGAMTARVPVAAHGFTVFSPQGKIVDLGTEFGLAVDEGGTTSVRVFAGELTAAVGRGEQDPVRLSQGQEARIDDRAVRVRADLDRQFTRAIVPPPEILARSLQLDFKHPRAGSVRDADGIGVGLTRRLEGTGSALLGLDPNLRIRTDLGALELTTTRSDLNKQAGLDTGEYLGVALKDLGFTGREDFTISAEVPNIPTLDVVGQFGLYAGVRSDRAIRGGVLRQPEADRYNLFLVNNNGGLDSDINEVGLTTTGDDLRFTLRRTGGAYTFLVENLTRRSTNALTIAPSPFLAETADLDVGLFGANTQSDLRKTLTIKQVEITVHTQIPAAPAPAQRDASAGAHPQR